MINNRKMVEVAGWYGISAVLGAYALVSFNVLGAQSVVYQLLNFSGALGIIWISALKGVTQSVVLNFVWAAIVVVTIIKVML